VRPALWLPAALSGGALLGAALFTGASRAQDDASAEAARLEQLAAEVRRLQDELAKSREEAARLQKSLDESQRRRAEREFAWFEYNRALVELRLSEKVPPFALDPGYEPKTVEVPPGQETPEAELARNLAERERDIEISLRHFLLVEEIRGLDLLEVGALDRGGIGPVVFRLLDDQGHLAGGLSAERLRLEGSRAGFTVTLVLENGFESRGGERMPFAGGERRIVLPYVDPEPWFASFPELFPANQIAGPLDDGRWERGRLQRELNRLLRETGELGHYRLSKVEGVLGDDLQLVQLEGFDAGGALERRLFADRMHLEREGGGVSLVLEGGVVVRGGVRTPFVDGVYRIFLPRAKGEAWTAAGLPGLSPPPEDGPAGAGER
jgi:hypothetical protein